ncbi:protein serine/threonine phosphatase [mine drainage metagenome]|uniref:Protein serine/threonine phosphatase n=1 Tax=mine drainage metagenome TaxID=410659 RepID=T1CA50_9ZZZZ
MTAGSIISATANSSAAAGPQSREGAAARGLITAEQAQAHPMRNYVECCLGGGAMLPDMAITCRRRLEPGDALLVCSDGLWGR